MKITSWISKILDVIDNGSFFRVPMEYCYRIIGVLSMCLCSIIGLSFPYLFIEEMDRAFSSTFFAFVDGAALAVFFIAMGLFLLYFWFKRAKQLNERIPNGSDTVTIPIIADFIQCSHECTGLIYMIFIPIALIFFGFVGQFGLDHLDATSAIAFFILAIPVSVVFILIGFGIVLLGHFIGERLRAIATIVNNTSEIKKSVQK